MGQAGRWTRCTFLCTLQPLTSPGQLLTTKVVTPRGGGASSFAFFHPDCTVGPGVSPDHAAKRLPLAGFTAGRELQLCLLLAMPLTLPRRFQFSLEMIITGLRSLVKGQCLCYNQPASGA